MPDTNSLPSDSLSRSASATSEPTSAAPFHCDIGVPDNQNHGTAISFGPFQLFPKSRFLEKTGTPLYIGGRALDILIALAEHAGEVVDKRELAKRVWANVDEGTFASTSRPCARPLEMAAEVVVMSSIPGRGYCLAAPLVHATSAGTQSTGAVSFPRPPRATRKHGRATRERIEDALNTIDAAIAQCGDSGESFDMPEMLRVKGDILEGLANRDLVVAKQFLGALN
jgi:DNA-binding winged helix-turn-helix (wHTH) protein